MPIGIPKAAACSPIGIGVLPTAWYYTNVKNMDTERAGTLDGINKDIDAMSTFMKVAAKKSAAVHEFQQAFSKCTVRKLTVPALYCKKHAESQFNALNDDGQAEEAVDVVLASSSLAPEDSRDIVEQYVLTKLGKTKPLKEPSSKDVRFLQSSSKNIADALRTKLTALSGPHASAVALRATQQQLKALVPLSNLAQQGSATKLDQSTMTSVSATVQCIEASRSSVRDDWSLYRSVSLVVAGKAFEKIANTHIKAAQWSDAFLVKVSAAETKLRSISDCGDLCKIDGVFVDLRVACTEDVILSVLDGTNPDENNFKAPMTRALECVLQRVLSPSGLADISPHFKKFATSMIAQLKMVDRASLAGARGRVNKNEFEASKADLLNPRAELLSTIAKYSPPLR